MTENRGKQNKILIVDDIIDNINVAANMLKSEDIDIGIALNAEEAIDFVRTNETDLILLDVMMPGMSGFELCEKLKADEATKDITIIFLTAKDSSEDVVKGFEIGAVDYVTKPFNAPELIARVHTQLTNINQKKQLKERKQFFNTIINSNTDWVFAQDKNNEILFANKSFLSTLELFEIKSCDSITFEELKNPEGNTPDIFKKDVSYVFNTKKKYYNPKEDICLPSGEKLSFEIQKIPLLDEEQKVFSVLTFAHDITRSVEAEEQLKQLNEELERLVEQRTQELEISRKNFKVLYDKSMDAIIINDFDGNILKVNEAACKMLGYTEKELVNLKTDRFLPANFWKKRENLREDLWSGKHKVYETVNIRKDGEEIPVEVSSTKIVYYDKEVLLSAGRDISIRKETEKQKLKTIIATEEKERKRFAKDLHDGLGATLSAAKMYLNIAKRTPDNPEKANEMLTEAIELIDKAGKNAKEIAVNIRPHDLSNFGLAVSLQNFCERINNIETIHINLDTSKFKAKPDDQQEQHIFRLVNELINNTLKYADAKDINIKLSSDDNVIFIDYEDNGKGFDYEKIMNSNKSGTGLDNIIERSEVMGGKAKITAQPGKGMKAQITLSI
jgi:PAS domain S-box-containing protein